MGLFRIFLAFPAMDALTKLFITFDRLNRFFWMIACFKGHNMWIWKQSSKKCIPFSRMLPFLKGYDAEYQKNSKFLVNSCFEKIFSGGSLCTRGAAGIWAVDLFSTTYLGVSDLLRSFLRVYGFVGFLLQRERGGLKIRKIVLRIMWTFP